ncbi:MAG: hypothetical protein PUH29_05540 [Lachnospiraceae bacterium]|nr:hypothetical protein [Lachnospiraceae bacterium]MDY5497800.1 hypothetical protein [Anaerobutyricum sp.]
MWKKAGGDKDYCRTGQQGTDANKKLADICLEFLKKSIFFVMHFNKTQSASTVKRFLCGAVETNFINMIAKKKTKDQMTELMNRDTDQVKKIQNQKTG